MWDPQHLTTLQVSTTYYGDSFTSTFMLQYSIRDVMSSVTTQLHLQEPK
jgi:hypothetical protein